MKVEQHVARELSSNCSIASLVIGNVGASFLAPFDILIVFLNFIFLDLLSSDVLAREYIEYVLVHFVQR